MEEKKVLQALVENLYLSIDEGNGTKFEVYSYEKLARAYSIAKQLYEYDLVDQDEVENFVKAVMQAVEK